MELLLFSLGTSEIFGINVFKVREVSPTPPITLTPNMPFGVEGVISLRGSIIPVISLGKFIKLDNDSRGPRRNHDRHRVLAPHPGLPGEGCRPHHPRRLG
jgi:chemotaxis signal transduction protein